MRLENLFSLHSTSGVYRGVTRGAQGGLHSPGAEWLPGAPKSPNNVVITCFNTVHLLPKVLRFEHGGAKLASCPGRHLTSLRPGCIKDCQTFLCWVQCSVVEWWALQWKCSLSEDNEKLQHSGSLFQNTMFCSFKCFTICYIMELLAFSGWMSCIWF